MAFETFTDKVVVVTGAGSGMGRAYAIEFEKVGAKLALCDIDPVGLAETVAALRSPGADRVLSAVVDVPDPRVGVLSAAANCGCRSWIGR